MNELVQGTILGWQRAVDSALAATGRARGCRGPGTSSYPDQEEVDQVNRLWANGSSLR